MIFWISYNRIKRDYVQLSSSVALSKQKKYYPFTKRMVTPDRTIATDISACLLSHLYLISSDWVLAGQTWLKFSVFVHIT